MLIRPISLSTLIALPATLLAQTNCESLKDLKLPGVTITSAQLVPESLTKASMGSTPVRDTLPEHCAVQAIARPTSDSEIRFEVWMPTAKWNGKFEQLGNGGWAGNIPKGDMGGALIRGYAAAATDDGHSAAMKEATWAIGHPEKLIDFGYRAVHETSVDAHAIVEAFYGRHSERSYFVGCSDGGREALMEAQRYPEDFDGIIAGAPANNWSHWTAGAVWNEQALLGAPGSAIPPAKLPAIQKAALDACDALDGVKDRLIEDPRVCHFNPDVIACKEGTDASDCLTPAQLSALKKIYAGPKDPRSGKQIFPGLAPGAETGVGGWNFYVTTSKPESARQFMYGNSYFGQAVYEQATWDFRSLKLTDDLDYADRKAGWILDSTNPDLRSFRDHHGKLIQYHGWGDAAISPYNSIEYYESVQDFMTKYPDTRAESTKPVSDFYRLFMIPGMGHCGIGDGPVRFGTPLQTWDPNDPERDIIAALDRWVKTGVAPEHIIGQGILSEDRSKTFTRPLCPYPKVAHYKGTGDPYNATSFECAVPVLSQ